MKLQRSIAIGGIISSLIVAFAFSQSVRLGKVDAQSIDCSSNRCVTGYAWSDTIGWISLSSQTDGSAIPYGIIAGAGFACANNLGNAATCYNLAGLSGQPGQAWSPNIGWIKFGTFLPQDFPQGPRYNARINDNATPNDDSDDYIEGWVRACSTFSSGCTGTDAASSIIGDWSGWISLSGSTYKTKLNAIDMSQAPAWGDQVVGWVGFKAKVDPLLQCALGIDKNGNCIVAQQDLAPIVDLKVGVGNNTPNLQSLTLDRNIGTTFKLGWTVGNANASTTCTASSVPGFPNVSNWNNAVSVPQNGGMASTSITVATTSTYTLKLECDNQGQKGSDTVRLILKDETEI